MRTWFTLLLSKVIEWGSRILRDTRREKMLAELVLFLLEAMRDGKIDKTELALIREKAYAVLLELGLDRKAQP